MSYVHKFMRTPVGQLKLIASVKGLAAVLWENDDPKRVALPPSQEHIEHPLLLEAERQLDEYFAGRRQNFQLSFDPVGTEFQKKVWRELEKIPFGETRSYGELAMNLGNPGASRAVGAANGKNPLSIVVPCHRVSGATGKLTGFAGGLETKARLLSLENRPELAHNPSVR